MATSIGRFRERDPSLGFLVVHDIAWLLAFVAAPLSSREVTQRDEAPDVHSRFCQYGAVTNRCDGHIWPLNRENAVLILPRMVRRVRAPEGPPGSSPPVIY
jgi:hypothetical protein